MMITDPAKIMVAGDWHGNANWAHQVIGHAYISGVDVIVHCGDFGWWVDEFSTHMYLRRVQDSLTGAGITLYWVDGNHEDHTKIEEWVDATNGQPWSDRRYPNIVHLPRGHRWEWWGETWLAMGGAHSVDRLQRTEGKSWWDGEHITESQADYAIAGGHADVMVCHDCPYGVQIPGILDDTEEDARRSGWPLSELLASTEHRKRLQRIVNAVKPKILLHGHYHRRYDAIYSHGGGVTRIVGLDMDATELDRNTTLLLRNHE